LLCCKGSNPKGSSKQFKTRDSILKLRSRATPASASGGRNSEAGVGAAVKTARRYKAYCRFGHRKRDEGFVVRCPRQPT